MGVEEFFQPRLTASVIEFTVAFEDEDVGNFLMDSLQQYGVIVFFYF